MRQQLLIETMSVTFEILEHASAKNGNLMKIRGTLTVADEINGNGRVYPEKILDREVEKINKLIAENEAFSEGDHPADGKSRIRNTAAMLTGKIEKKIVEDRKLYIGEALVLNTAIGKDLQAIISAGGKVGSSSRALGSIETGTWNGKTADIVQEDLNIKAFDFVIGQSTKDAKFAEITEQQMGIFNLIEAAEHSDVRGKPTTKGGNDVMDIKTVEDLRKAYPDLCEQMTKTAVEAREKELKEELSKEWDASAKEIADGIKKQIEESQEYKDFKSGMEIHKATLVEIGKLVKPYLGEGTTDDDDVAEIEERLAALESDLKATKDENKSLKEQMEKEKTETANKEKVKTRIAEVTAGKENGALIAEELKDCKTVEEVNAKLPEREAFIKKLLTEQKGAAPGDGKGKGQGQVLNEDKQDQQLTEQQKRDRRVAGLE